MEPMSTQPNLNSTSDPFRIVGAVLLAAGLMVGAWVLFNAYTLWTEPNTIGLLRKLAPTGELFAAFSSEKHGEVKIASKFLEYGNLTLAVGILWIGAGIGKSLIEAGARLVGFRAKTFR